MLLMLTVLAFTWVLEFLLWIPGIRRAASVLAWLPLVLVAVVSGLLLGEHVAWWTAAMVFLSVYRIVNLLRVTQQRITGDYLETVVLRSSSVLCSVQAVIVAVVWLVDDFDVQVSVSLYALYGLQLILALVLVLSTLRHVRTTRPPQLAQAIADRDLPTLTVAIPARNETADLAACLQSLLASNYPKLEILVLDDCSQQRRTAEIIRGFAQQGVRFIAGAVPPERWLAKNYAYHQLVQAASGDILLFAGVDARFQPSSLRALVTTMLRKKKSMVSIVPRNIIPSSFSLKSLLVQPSRYAWELSLPRRLLNRPPVLSTCWLIDHSLLLSSGGFEAVMRSISPESYFARKAITKNDGYSFVRSNNDLGIASAKSLSEQQATAIRVRYPQLHRRPELVALLTPAEVSLLVVPLASLLFNLVTGSFLLAAVSGVTILLTSLLFSLVSTVTYQRFLKQSLFLAPFAALYDIALLNYSMWRYEFAEVIWKDRNVCVPVMRTYRSLPKV